MMMNSSESKKESYSIRLSGVDPTNKSKKNQQQQRHVVRITTNDTTFGELDEITLDLFISTNSKKKKCNNDYRCEYSCGYPPRAIDFRNASTRENVLRSSLLVSSYIRGGENVMVKFLKKDERKKEGMTVEDTNISTNSEKDVDTHLTKKRPRRKAAELATESFADTIRLQNEMMKKEEKSSKMKRRRTNNNSKNNNTIKTTQSSEQKKKQQKRTEAHFRKIQSLPTTTSSVQSGNSSSNTQLPSSSTSQRNHNKTSSSLFSKMSSEDDISTTLISSLQGGQSKVSLVLRHAMKNAVLQRYEASRAAVRVASLIGGANNKIQFRPCPNSSQYEVQYPKGVEGRGFYKDQVSIISVPTLEAVVKSVYSSKDDDNEDDNEDALHPREMLRPIHMAQLSPRVFWSLVYHYCFHSQQQSQIDNDKTPSTTIEQALHRLLPQLDWKFLERRTVMMSEKARENERQKKSTDSSDIHKAQKAVEQVEKAMEQTISHSRDERRKRLAEAALSRSEQSSALSSPSWSLSTPTELDHDELRECIIQGYEQYLETNVNNILNKTTSIDPKNVNSWISIIVEKCDIHNWRELANADSSQLLLEFSSFQSISSDVIDSWIDYAQQQSLDEIMLEILDAKDSILELLRNEANAGTPKDLALWETIPTMLLEQVPSLLETEHESSIQKWCHRASVALSTFEWLKQYTTPIG